MSEREWPADLQQRLRDFARARKWEKYHTPRNLAALISSEAGELLALFRWDQDALVEDRERVEQELADVLLGILRFADIADIDLHAAGIRKLERNATKYPAHHTAPDPEAPRGDRVACGIDSGTFKSNSYVAWLRGNHFLLTSYRPTADAPLPEPPSGWDLPQVFALDLPQGLAQPGAKRRTADAQASTPTRVLPANRGELQEWKLYKGFIAAGVETFWSIHVNAFGNIGGLGEKIEGRPAVVETYPRYVIRRLWPDLKIPSKRTAPEEYTRVVWGRLRAAGFRCTAAPSRPDHVDAMLCAVAARAWAESDGRAAGTVGTPPYIDEVGRVIREGYIVAP
jgi:dCTP diphosphatase